MIFMHPDWTTPGREPSGFTIDTASGPIARVSVSRKEEAACKRQPDTISLLFALAKGVTILSGWVTGARDSQRSIGVASNETVRDVKRNDSRISGVIAETRRNWKEMTRGIKSRQKYAKLFCATLRFDEYRDVVIPVFVADSRKYCLQIRRDTGE
ncbi:hypothetical protein HN011_003864 [Eciton burchellii]|nr:hypothetical protein HN011_003864 [Eciton burchellii]